VRSDETLYALDRATRAIAGELDLERVLQQIVDSVRALVQTRYAALGIVGSDELLERFITSGIAPALRARIGHLPRGHGLLGTIIREGVSLRIPDIANHPDSYGFPASHPPMHSFLGVPIRVGGETVGNFYLTEKANAEEFSAKDQEIVEMFALHAGIAIQNAHLHQEVQKLAIVDERLRISRDLHDGIIQSIYGVSLSLEEVLELVGTDDPEAVARVDRAIDRLHTTIGDIRQFIVALGPQGEEGIAAIVEATARELLAGSPTELAVDLSGAATIDQRMTPEAGHELVQIAREALSNIARHSQAHNATLRIALADDIAEMLIEDDGAGFDPARRLGSTHFGLANLRDRAAAVGGSLEVDSEPGRGTRIIVRLPVATPGTPS
jgi:signal transduction histidine kinase